MTTLDDLGDKQGLLAELHIIFADFPQFEDPQPAGPVEIAACRRRALELFDILKTTPKECDVVPALEAKVKEPLIGDDGTAIPVTDNLKLWCLEFQNQHMFFHQRQELLPACERLVSEWFHDDQPMTLLRLMTYLEVTGGTVTLN